MPSNDADDSRDLLSSRFATVAIYWLPIAVLIASGLLPIGNIWRAALWAVALMTMGVGCVLNALRCGRVHCFVTGPFFLLMAAVTLLYGLGVVPLGPRGWNTIALATFVGGLTLCYVPEFFFGRYR